MNYFITGTDTGVGKTYVTSLLIQAFRAAGHDTVGFKPICCGSRDDAEALAAAADGRLSVNEVNPVWFRAEAAPYAAALIENRLPDLDLIRETFRSIRTRHQSVLVEGAGGWLVPILKDYSIADLAREMDLPVIVVSSNRLGTLNHTLLTVKAVRSSGLTCSGVILNNMKSSEEVAVVTNKSLLEELLDVPILAEVQPNQEKGSCILPDI